MSLDLPVKLLVLATLLLTAACAHVPLKAEAPVRVLVLNMRGANVDAAASLITHAGADLVLMQDVDPAALNALGTKLHFAAAAGGSVAALARGFIGFNATIPFVVAIQPSDDPCFSMCISGSGNCAAMMSPVNTIFSLGR